MNFKIDEVLLRRKNKLIISGKEVENLKEVDKQIVSYVIAIQKNIETYGYTFDRHVFATLCDFDTYELESFYFQLLPQIKSLCAADVQYRPMYPNFPKQVAEMEDVELYLNAIIHYITYGEYLPSYTKQERLPFIDGCKPSKFADSNARKMVVLSLGNNLDVMEIFKNLLGSRTSISEQDKCDIAHIIREFPNYADNMPEEIPFKENVSFVTKTIIENNPKYKFREVSRYFKTATDVLRLAVALCDGDISLAGKPQLHSFRRKQRRLIMNLLANCGKYENIIEDMYRHPSEWIHLGEWIHPCEEAFQDKRYKNVRIAFNTLRNLNKPVLFMTKVEEGTKQGKVMEVANLLKSRPGDFARRLDKLLRDADSYKDRMGIAKAFDSVAEKVSTPVLLQVRQHFTNRILESDPKEKKKNRIFFPKGNTAKVVSIPNELKDIEQQSINNVRYICQKSLIKNYAKREPLGNVYIDPKLEKIVAPLSQRSATSSNKILTRGSRIKLNDSAKVVRGFIWWTNMKHERVDLDLSAVMLDDDFKYINHISYTNLRDGKIQSYHSGDITNGGNVNGEGVAEFIDFDIEAVRKQARYVCFTVNNFTQQHFSELPNCRFGWMERENVNSGEIFEPSTVDMAIKPTSQSSMIIPVLFDTETKEFIWMDVTCSGNLQGSFYVPNNVENNMKGICATCYALANIRKPNLFDVISLNVKARGVRVYSREEADIIFSNDTTIPMESVIVEDEETKEQKEIKREKDVKIITAYDIDYIVGQLI